MPQASVAIREIVINDPQAILREWLQEVDASAGASDGIMAKQSFGEGADSVLAALQTGLAASGDVPELDRPEWDQMRAALQSVSSTGAAKGISAAATSAFVLSLKRPLFERIQLRMLSEPAALAAALWFVSTLVDKMSQVTLTTYQQTREDVISRQQAELLELSTPVVKLWQGVLAVPMIGTLDSARTQLVMENLLQAIVDTGSEIAIIDITGVPTVDTLVAQHLLKTVTAIRLMGAECLISGVRPQIAQTIVHLGIDLQGVTTKATLADALALALKRSGFNVTRAQV